MVRNEQANLAGSFRVGGLLVRTFRNVEVEMRLNWASVWLSLLVLTRDSGSDHDVRILGSRSRLGSVHSTELA